MQNVETGVAPDHGKRIAMQLVRRSLFVVDYVSPVIWFDRICTGHYGGIVRLR